MKKVLLLAALAASMSVNAQDIQIGTVDAAVAGLGASAVALPAGTQLAKTTNVTLTTAFADSYKVVTVNGPKVNDASLKQINFGTSTNIFGDDNGVQGSANPKASDGTATGLAVPVEGCVYKFDVTTDGALYIFFKASSNKTYAVYENGNLVGHTYAQAAEAPLPQLVSYTLTGNADWNYITTNECTVGRIYWPEQFASGMTLTDSISKTTIGANAAGTAFSKWAKIGKNGVGFVKVNAYEGNTYLFNAFGSKASLRGFVFVPGDPETLAAPEISVSTDGGDKVTLQTAGSTGINSITTDTKTLNVNAPIYNVAGQQVSKAYKGIVIQNGHKFINK